MEPGGRGALAVQVPANGDSPLHQALLETAGEEPWRPFTSPCRDLLVYHDPPFYYGLLEAVSGNVDEALPGGAPR